MLSVVVKVSLARLKMIEQHDQAEDRRQRAHVAAAQPVEVVLEGAAQG